MTTTITAATAVTTTTTTIATTITTDAAIAMMDSFLKSGRVMVKGLTAPEELIAIQELQDLLLRHADSIGLGDVALWGRVVIVVDGEMERTSWQNGASSTTITLPRDVKRSRLIPVLKRLGATLRKGFDVDDDDG